MGTEESGGGYEKTGTRCRKQERRQRPECIGRPVVPIDAGRSSEERSTTDRGPGMSFGGKGGHEVDRPLQAKAVSPHLPGIWLPDRNNEPDRGKNKNQKLIEGPGNEQRSERVGQPLGPPGINAPLTQVGVSAEISYRNPIGGTEGK